MKLWRLVAIAVVYVATCIGWLVLGGVTHLRANEQSHRLRDSVTELWGSPQVQSAPELTLRPRPRVDGEGDEAQSVEASPVHPSSTDIDVSLHADPRQKGLVWYALYDVSFAARWTYAHVGTEPGQLDIRLTLPNNQAIYDDFRFLVDGVDRAASLDPTQGAVHLTVGVEPGETVEIAAGYRSRGLDQWVYRPSAGVARLEDFKLRMHTDFEAIDFPAATMSPSSRQEEGQGHVLAWEFTQVVTGNGIGMVMPHNLQPGELAAALTLSAPVSLLFFFGILFVLATLRRIDIHPINYLFLGAAFFAFHLLFAYTADTMPVSAAFALCSVTSVFLVVSYLRLVVSDRFAFVEAAGAQLVYLVGFSMAHFWEGRTGLTVTLLAVVTLFVLMQLTGRIRWSELTASGPHAPPEPFPGSPQTGPT